MVANLNHSLDVPDYFTRQLFTPSGINVKSDISNNKLEFNNFLEHLQKCVYLSKIQIISIGLQLTIGKENYDKKFPFTPNMPAVFMLDT